MFYITGKLVFKSYKPLKLERGMYFLIRNNAEMMINQLDHIPLDEDEYIQKYGYPVEPCIIYPGNPNIADDGFVIAQPHQIGWWDEGEHTDELRNITTEEINNIIDLYDGWVDVEIEEELVNERPIPIMAEGLCILSYDDDDDEDDDEDDVYFFDDDEPYQPPSSNDEWEQNNFNNQNSIRYDKDEE